MTRMTTSPRARRPKALRGNLSLGDLVLVHEVFDDEEVEWITHNGCAIVIDIEGLPSSSYGLEVSTAYRLVTVLVDGKIIDDYFENELTPV
jgi:hypothetical protein